MKKIILVLLSCCSAILMQAQVSKTVSCTAGSLSTLLTSAEKSTVTNLTITGTIDVRDFLTMRDNMPLLAEIDLSVVSIVAFNDVTGLIDFSFLVYSVNQIPQGAFRNKTSLTSIILPTSITSVGPVAFSGCTGLKSIMIPSLVTWIGGQSFCGCTSLTSVILASSVTSIGMGAFGLCTGVQSIYAYSNSPVDFGTLRDIFTGIDKSTCILYVPVGAKSVYQEANQWLDFTNIVEMDFTNISVTGIVLNSTTQVLEIGSLSTIIATILPVTATNQSVTWISSNPQIATVDAIGTVTGINKGTATITAVSNAKTTVTASCNITVSIPLSGGLTATLTHLDSVYYYWNAHKKLTVDHKPTLITFDFSDTTNLPFSKFLTQSVENGNSNLQFYKYSWDAIEKALKIDVDFTLGGTVTPPTSNYAAVLVYRWLKNIQGVNSMSFNPFVNSGDSVEGVMLDLSAKANRVFKMNCKPLNLSDSAEIRVDLGDANGRESNYCSPKHTLKPSTGYQDLRFSWGEDFNQINEWNQDIAIMQDGYSDSWLNISTNRGISPGTLVNGLPNLRQYTDGRYDLDTSNIAHWMMYFDDGRNASSGNDVSFSLYVKKIQIGDQTAEGTANEYVFGGVKSGFQGNYISLNSLRFSSGTLSTTSFYKDSSIVVYLPAGSMVVPTAIATANKVDASIKITNATSLSDTTKIVVNSIDGTMSKTYIITFKVLSNDATLSSLSINNGLLTPVFSSSSYTYNVNLPVGTIAVPVIMAITNNIGAKIVVSNASKIPGTTTIYVTAEDGTTKTYTINFYTGIFKEISFVLSRFIIFENDNINIGACINTFNNVSVRFKSGDTSLVKINNLSILKGIKHGTTKIYAINVNDSLQMDSASVLVLPNIIIVGATVLAGGTQIELYVNGDFPLYSGIENDFYLNSTLKANTNYTVTHVMKKTGSTNVLLLQLDKQIEANQTLIINYAPIRATTATSEVRTSFTITNTGSEEPILLNVKLYPNPVQTSINIEAPDLQTVTIYNIQGQKVATFIADGEILRFSVESLPAGMYVAEIITTSQNVKKSFIKR